MKMEQQLFADMPVEERRQHLEANADEIRQHYEVTRMLTDEEVRLIKLEHSDNSLKLYQLQKEKEKVLQQFKEQMDPLKKDNKEMMRTISSRVETVSGTAYVMRDFDSRQVGFYDETGKLLNTERMVGGNDAQMTIMSKSIN